MHELLPFGELATPSGDHAADLLQSWELAHILRIASGGQASSVAALMAARHHGRTINRTQTQKHTILPHNHINRSPWLGALHQHGR